MSLRVYFALLFTSVLGLAGAQTTSVSSGNWSDPSVWSTGVVPPATATVNVVHPLILDQNITITTGTYSFFQNVTDAPGGTAFTLTANTAGGTLDIKAGTTTFEGAASFDNSTLFVRNGATLIVGPLTINNNTTLTVESGGTLIINGNFTNNNNGTGTFTIAGVVQVNGNYSAPVGNVSLSGTGSFITTGTISTTGSSNVFGSTNDCGTGPCSGNNLCAFSNAIAAAQTLCSGGTPAALTGNAVGSPTYNWESSTASSTSGFSLASGTNNTQNYTPGSLTQTTWLRRKVTSGGCTGISVAIQLTVAPSAGGWIGTTNDWNTASNWCNNAVPISTTDVTISTGVANMPQITAASNCRTLTISSGASVTINASNTLSIFGDLTNNGTFTTNTSTVTLSGTVQQTIGGSNPITFNNLTLNNSSGSSPQVLLTTFVTVNNIFSMTSGDINLSGYNFTLGTSAASPGTLTYSAGELYGGNFTRWFGTPTVAIGNSAGLFPIGTSTNYRPFFVGYTSALTSGGTIRVGHTNATTTSTVSFADGGSTVVRRQDSFWSVATGNGLNVGATPFDLRAEGTGFGTVGAVSDLRLVRLADATGIGTAAASAGTVTNPQLNRTVSPLSGLTNNFYVGSINAVNSPLPITLSAFGGTATSDGVILQWTTQTEINFDYFQLERSVDGHEFQSLTRMKGRSTRPSKTEYSYLDASAQRHNYYRLRMVDNDGTTTFSKIVLVEANDLIVFNVYPNPITNKKFTIEFFETNNHDIVKITLYDQLGKIWINQEFETQNQEVDAGEGIPSGLYILKVSKGFNTKTVKLVMQ